jgi:iron complex transport system substrate-binding protein
MSNTKLIVQRFTRLSTIFMAAIILSIGVASMVSISPASADEPLPTAATWTPAISVFLPDGVTPYTGQPLYQDNSVIVKGEGFDPASNVGGRGAPIPNTLSQGIYVVFGSFLDAWKPSTSAPGTARKVLDSKWALTEDVLNQVPSQFQPAIRPQWIELKPDGTFSSELKIADLANGLADGKWGIYTYPAGGMTNPSQELSVPLNVDPAGAPVPEVTTPEIVVAPNQVTRTQAIVQEETCTAQAVNNATLNWGIGLKFTTYIQSSIAKGKVTTNGVNFSNSIFGFTGGSGEFNVKDSMGEISLPGSIRFVGHSGILDSTISNIKLRISNSTSGILYADYSAKDMDGKQTSGRNVAFASVGFNSSVQNNVLVISGTRTTLLNGGTNLFAGNYKAGEALELINLRAPLGTTMVCGVSTSRTLANTGSDSETILLASMLFILLGSCLLVTQKKTRYFFLNRESFKKKSSIVSILLVGVLIASCGTSTTKVDSKKSETTKVSANKVNDPRAITGPSTATSVKDVEPISSNPSIKLPVTFTDERGEKVVVSSIDRIIALDLYGTLAQTVVGLGLGDKLVGRGQTTTSETLKDLPVVTQNGIVLNAEAILKLKPTVVLVDSSLGPISVAEQLESSGISVVHLSEKRNLESLSNRIKAVANALGVSDAGKKLATRVSNELVEAEKKIAKLAPKSGMRMTFLYLRGTGGYFFILGEGEGADDLIDTLKGIDVATKMGTKGATPVVAETLIGMDPEVIITMTDGLKSTGGVDALLNRPGVKETTAGQNKRIVDMADGQVLAFGPNIADVLVSLATAIYNPNVK